VKPTLDFIGKNIRFLRRQSSWTLAELATRVGMSEGPLGRIERGVNAPSASVIYRLSKVFGASVNALLQMLSRTFTLYALKESRILSL